ncbi:hypothetical protein [Brevibacillus ruminantium]|nr:hypothetical protein [Brevibacillus ruminantium]
MQNKNDPDISPQDLQLVGLILAAIGAVLQTIGYAQEIHKSTSKK